MTLAENIKQRRCDKCGYWVASPHKHVCPQDDGLDLDDVAAGHLTALRELAELRDTVRLSAIESAVNAACTCGGGQPGACCPACEVWHIVSGRVTP